MIFKKLLETKPRNWICIHSDSGFDANTCSVMVSLDKQSSDIAQGVNEGEGGTFSEQGAGDQGLMLGFG